MIKKFIPMARRTVNLPDSVEALAREAAEPGESFSATVSRLIEAGVRAILVGETLMRAPDIGAQLDELRGVTTARPAGRT